MFKFKLSLLILIVILINGSASPANLRNLIVCSIANCSTCASETSCATCADTFYLAEADTQCLPCPTGCKR